MSNLPRFDVLVLTEIGARNIDLTVNLFDGYKFLYILPDKNVNWGVAIYISDSLNDVFLTNSQFKKTCTCPRCEIESLVIDFTHCGSKYTICGLYRHPNGDVLHFINDLEHMIKSLDVKYNWILAGDINIDLIKYQDENVLKYLTSLMSYQMCPVATLLTRVTLHSATCIDHLFIKASYTTTLLPSVLYCAISNYMLTALLVNTRHKVRINQRPVVRIFGNRNCEYFIEAVRNIDWDMLFENENNLYEFINRLTEIYNNSFPLRKLSRKRAKDKPWITKGLKISVKHKNRLYKKAITSKSDHIYCRYLEYKIRLTKCIKQVETKYLSELLDNHASSAKRTRKHLAKMLNKHKNKQANINKVMYEGQMYTDTQEIVEAFNDHFCTVGDKLSAKLPNLGNEYQKCITSRLSDSFLYHRSKMTI